MFLGHTNTKHTKASKPLPYLSAYILPYCRAHNGLHLMHRGKRPFDAHENQAFYPDSWRRYLRPGHRARSPARRPPCHCARTKPRAMRGAKAVGMGGTTSDARVRWGGGTVGARCAACGDAGVSGMARLSHGTTSSANGGWAATNQTNTGRAMRGRRTLGADEADTTYDRGTRILAEYRGRRSTTFQPVDCQ